jgi:hypothetical protein
MKVLQEAEEAAGAIREKPGISSRPSVNIDK